MVPFNQIGSLQEIHYDFFLQDLYHVLFKIYIYWIFTFTGSLLFST